MPQIRYVVPFIISVLPCGKAFFDFKEGDFMEPNEIIGMILSLIGMTVNIISFQVKNKFPLLIMQTAGSTLFMISYMFSGAGIGIVLNVLMLIRNFLFMLLSKKRGKAVVVFVICMCISYVVSYIVYTAFAGESFADNIWNLFPIIAAFFGTISFANTNVNRLRVWKYGDSICWLTYNTHIGWGALGGILGEILNLISLTVGIIRFRERKEKMN